MVIRSLTFAPIEKPLPAKSRPAWQRRVPSHMLSMPFALLTPPVAAPERRPLTEADAVDIWIARWLKIRRRDLVSRYACDPRRLYEIWEEARFPGVRAKAEELFSARYPSLLDRVDFGPHQRIARGAHPDQLTLFD